MAGGPPTTWVGCMMPYPMMLQNMLYASSKLHSAFHDLFWHVLTSDCVVTCSFSSAHSKVMNTEHDKSREMLSPHLSCPGPGFSCALSTVIPLDWDSVWTTLKAGCSDVALDCWDEQTGHLTLTWLTCEVFESSGWVNPQFFAWSLWSDRIQLWVAQRSCVDVQVMALARSYITPDNLAALLQIFRFQSCLVVAWIIATLCSMGTQQNSHPTFYRCSPDVM